MGCTHDITEREVAVTADGYCPLCMADEIERLRSDLDVMESKRNTASVNLVEALKEIERLQADKTAISQTASDFLHEIERLRAALQSIVNEEARSGAYEIAQGALSGH